MREEPAGKYSPGEIIFSKVDPGVKLKIRRYVNRIYYCRFVDDPDRKEVVLFEREIADKVH
ncbi:MAG: hypothetical protein WBB45_19180 [Cyclobacteriaceae bacterium]